MGFYIRKSINVGGLRFNLSNSGIGVSTGFRGFRIGTGPRGNYVSMGGGGIYYRKTFSSPGHHTSVVNAPPVSRPQMQPSGSLGATTVIDSAPAVVMTDSNSLELLAELNEKRKKIPLFPFAIAFSVACLLLSVVGAPIWVWIAEFLALPVLCFYAYRFDGLRRTTVLFYNLDPQSQQVYQRLHQECDRLGSCQAIWNVEQQTAVTNAKYHAGANQLVERHRVRIGSNSLPRLKMNIDPISIPAGRQTLYLLPDRVLISDSTGVGALDYKDIGIGITTTRFIESDSLPSDATVVDRTWRYVNKKSGPDRRFADNRELPVCQYEELRLMSRQGLNELFQLSRIGLSSGFKSAFETMTNLARVHAPSGRAGHQRHP